MKPPRPLFTLGLALVLAPALAARADEAKAAAPKNRDLEAARRLVLQHRIDAALKELDIAARLPGNTPRTALEIAAVRSEALLLQPHPDEVAARGLILQVLHQDPDGGLYQDAPDEVAETVAQLKEGHPLVLGEVPAQSSPGYPVRIRARVRDPKGVVRSVTLHMKGHLDGSWTMDAMKKEPGGYTGYIRDPALLAPPGVKDGFVVDCYLSGEDKNGQVVDTDGAEDSPLTITITSKTPEAKLDLADLTLRDKPPAPVVKPVAHGLFETENVPWWRRWYTLAGAGAVVVGGTVAAIVVASQPPKLDDHIGILHLP